MDVLRAAPATWPDEKPAVSWGKHAHKDLPRGKMCCAEKAAPVPHLSCGGQGLEGCLQISEAQFPTNHTLSRPVSVAVPFLTAQVPRRSNTLEIRALLWSCGTQTHTVTCSQSSQAHRMRHRSSVKISIAQIRSENRQELKSLPKASQKACAWLGGEHRSRK